MEVEGGCMGDVTDVCLVEEGGVHYNTEIAYVGCSDDMMAIYGERGALY